MNYPLLLNKKNLLILALLFLSLLVESILRSQSGYRSKLIHSYSSDLPQIQSIRIIEESTPSARIIGIDYSQPTPSPTPEPTPLPTPTPSPTATPSPTPNPSLETSINPPDNLHQIFMTAAESFQLDPSLLVSIADCESGLNPTATNHIYAGLFQFSPNTWESTRTHMGENPDQGLRFDPAEAIKTAAFKIANGGISAWKNCNPPTTNS